MASMVYFTSRVNAFVRAFIVSDALLYSALNVVNILFAVYVTSKVPGGNVTVATTALIAGFVVRIIAELGFGRTSSSLSERGKIFVITAGMACMSLGYIGMPLVHNLIGLSAMWALNGLGWAIAYPAKLALVAKYIKPDQASQEWGATDALNMSLIVVTMALGTYIVTHFSYGLMFTLAAILNALGIMPYVAYLRGVKRLARDDS
jgi:hypothetical protein